MTETLSTEDLQRLRKHVRDIRWAQGSIEKLMDTLEYQPLAADEVLLALASAEAWAAELVWVLSPEED